VKVGRGLLNPLLRLRQTMARHLSKPDPASDDVSGRRAYYRCSVLGYPCRIDFSRAACLLTSAIGKSTSARRLQSLGITPRL